MAPSVPSLVLCWPNNGACRNRWSATRGEFLTVELPNALRAAAAKLAQFLGGLGADFVFTENATAGVNAILQSVRI